MLEKGRIGRGQRGELALGIVATAAHGQNQRAGIVVNAIAMAAIGDVVDAVLEDPGAIAHPLDGSQRQRRYASLAAVARVALAGGER